MSTKVEKYIKQRLWIPHPTRPPDEDDYMQREYFYVVSEEPIKRVGGLSWWRGKYYRLAEYRNGSAACYEESHETLEGLIESMRGIAPLTKWRKVSI